MRMQRFNFEFFQHFLLDREMRQFETHDGFEYVKFSTKIH